MLAGPNEEAKQQQHRGANSSSCHRVVAHITLFGQRETDSRYKDTDTFAIWKHTILEVEAKMTNDQRLSSDKRHGEPTAAAPTTKIIYYCFKHLCFALKRDTFVSSMPPGNLFLAFVH